MGRKVTPSSSRNVARQVMSLCFARRRRFLHSGLSKATRGDISLRGAAWPAMLSPGRAAMRKSDVLIVGAGPTGLVLALWLTRAGVRVRIVDKSAEPGTTSRALVVHARTLELYRQLGIAEELTERGLRFTAINMWVRGEHTARAAIGDIGLGLSPFPYMIIFPQDEHEQMLLEHLRRAGIEVERRTELLGFQDRGDSVVARLRGPAGAEGEHEAPYLAGCDGAHSRVREGLGVGFPGGTYERVFYVADVALRGPVANGELHVALDDADLLAVFPMKGAEAGRLIGTVRKDLDDKHDLTWEDVSTHVVERMKITVDRVNWFSTYRVHHRVAEHFARGRVFLVGDAAHIHSPVGGQGMNTGIGDAVNLAWKLASVLRGRADERLLTTYEPERIAFAKRLVATTDRAFTFATRDGPIARLVRLDAVPALAPALLGRSAVRRLMFRTVSQTFIDYHGSDLSEGRAGSVRGGDRLPWVAAADDGKDNFAPLASLEWQLHVYGSASPDLAKVAADRGLPLSTFPWREAHGEAGLARDAAYLLRPDGHVALADRHAHPATLETYLTAHGLRHLQCR
jgi:2-polyprenyl-6-methoxyphenol hydroxylase-like FAD-dependent oxidoreductase